MTQAFRWCCRVCGKYYTAAYGIAVLALLPRLDGFKYFHGQSLWAQDGHIFINSAQEMELAAFTQPYAGYLHLYPRLAAELAQLVAFTSSRPSCCSDGSLHIWSSHTLGPHCGQGRSRHRGCGLGRNGVAKTTRSNAAPSSLTDRPLFHYSEPSVTVARPAEKRLGQRKIYLTVGFLGCTGPGPGPVPQRSGVDRVD